MASTRNPDLHLIVEGVPVRPRFASAQVYEFSVPGGSRRVTIASRSVVPLDAGGTDPRRLGVPLHQIVVKGATGSIEVGPDHQGLSDGFHQDEGTHRWTNGRGVIPCELMSAATGDLTVEVHIGKIELQYPA